MKTIAIALALAGLTAGGATAQTTVTTRTVTHTHSETRPVGARHARRVCTVRYRHHQRIRTCRTVRY